MAKTQSITSFSLSAASIKDGDSAVLKWQTQRAKAVYLNGEAVVLSGSKPVSPKVSTTYRLDVDGPAPRMSRTLALTVTVVVPPPPPPTGGPRITNATATPSTLEAPGPVVIDATVTNAVATTLDGAPVTLPATVQVGATHTFTLAASAAAPASATASAAVMVTPAGGGGGGGLPPGPGLVWEHRFESDGEITAFLPASTQGPSVVHAGPALLPFRVSDPVVGNAMRMIALGARLAAEFPASGGVGPRPLVIDDDTYWPDPATAGMYYVHTTRPFKDQQNNLWSVTAKSGKTLTVTYVPTQAQTIAPTLLDWHVGDHIGHQSSSNWMRLLSALKGDSNGRGVDDVNLAGNILRSRHDQTNFPRGLSVFGYGWYGRPEYQAEFATWRPSDYGVGAVDNVLRSNVWDGDEFWLRFRQKIDPRFFPNACRWGLPGGVDPSSEDNRFGRKIWMLQAEISAPQQITGGYGPSNRYQIPSTPEPPVALAAYSHGGGLAGRALANWTTGSYQPGSAWAATALPQSFLPAGSAYETPAGEWVTFLLRVKPGLRWSTPTQDPATYRNTVIELRVAREADPDYTLVFSMADQGIIYGSSNVDSWIMALPGYNAITFTGYLNIELGSVPPMCAYYVDIADVALSKQFIPR